MSRKEEEEWFVPKGIQNIRSAWTELSNKKGFDIKSYYKEEKEEGKT